MKFGGRRTEEVSIILSMGRRMTYSRVKEPSRGRGEGRGALRKSGIVLALGLIASAAGVSVAEASPSPSSFEAQIERIQQLSSTGAVQEELTRLLATDPDSPAVQLLLQRLTQLARAGAPRSDGAGGNAGGSDHETGPY
jgi:hypothetical protein